MISDSQRIATTSRSETIQRTCFRRNRSLDQRNLLQRKRFERIIRSSVDPFFKVAVNFNGKVANILETAENLLTVIAPAIDPVLLDTPIEVEVSNKYQNELWTAEKKLTYIYHSG